MDRREGAVHRRLPCGQRRGRLRPGARRRGASRRRALELEGFRFIHILAPCPTGWKSEPEDGIALVRNAVASGLYPIYEVFDGRRYEINIEPSADPVDAMANLERWLGLQGRFRSTGPDADSLRPRIDDQWRNLRRLASD